jgi:membrane protein
MKTTSADLYRKIRLVLREAGTSFNRNNDLTAASSLAFSAMLALIPALFLLTFLLGAAIGSSAGALQRTQELVGRLIPDSSQVILREVSFIAGHKGTIGFVNLLVFFWSTTPLVADMRVCLNRTFRRKPSRPFLLEKLFDAAISMVFLLGLSAVAVAGVFLQVMNQTRPFRILPAYAEGSAVFLAVMGVVFALYFTFSNRVPVRALAAGAFSASLLWFLLRPVFHLFLTYNPGYGLAFGSFKSLFVVIIWIYISMALFLFGAEIASALAKGDTVYLKRLVEGDRRVPAEVVSRYVLSYPSGSVIFKDGDPGSEMYAVLRGAVSIRKNGQEIGSVPAGRSFGGLSFLLSSRRVATAVAAEDAQLVVLNNENINNLMNEFPEMVVEMLREMAMRLRESNKTID